MKNKQSIIFYIILFIFCMFSMHLYGRTSPRSITYALWMLMSLYVTIKISRRLFLAYFGFTVLVALLYGCTGLVYGKMSYATAAALINTDIGETSEFFATLPIKVYITMLLYIIMSIVGYIAYKKVAISKQKSKSFYAILTITIAVFSTNMYNSINNGYKQPLTLKILGGIDYYPFRVPAEFTYYGLDYFDKLNQFENIKNTPDTFEVTDVQNKNEINVMIIGESMRRDYMSSYGYPYPTTPFLDIVPGIFWDNFIAASGATSLSLERSLFSHQPDNIEKPIYTNSVTALAKKAGYHQYWISGQGVYSIYATAATIASLKADERWFVGGTDFGLLKHVDTAIAEKHNKPKLITLHINGSHSGFCSRVTNEYDIKKFENTGDENLGCYLNSLKQTDNLIKRIHEKLQATGKSFSIMYFSDHGLSDFSTDLSGFHLTHSGRFKENYDIPMVILSSDDKTQQRITSRKSGYDFMPLFAQWLGITEKALVKQNSSMFKETSETDISVFNFDTVVSYDSLKNDAKAVLPNSKTVVIK